MAHLNSAGMAVVGEPRSQTTGAGRLVGLSLDIEKGFRDTTTTGIIIVAGHMGRDAKAVKKKGLVPR